MIMIMATTTTTGIATMVTMIAVTATTEGKRRSG
jgi:hypothetical protein